MCKDGHPTTVFEKFFLYCFLFQKFFGLDRIEESGFEWVHKIFEPDPDQIILIQVRNLFYNYCYSQARQEMREMTRKIWTLADKTNSKICIKNM